MAGSIKGITIQLGADTTKLSNALNTANKSIKATQTGLKSVEKALKLDPTNINLLKDKQQLLADKVADTTTKLDALKQAQSQLDAQGVDKNSKEYQELQRDIDLCEEYCIGPLFNSCSTIYGIEKSKNIFYLTFKDKIKETNKKLMELTNYEKFIDSQFLQEYIEFGKIKAFLDSDNLDKLSELSTEEINECLLYCNNNLFRAALYLIKFKDIETSSNLSPIHPQNLDEKFIEKNKAIIKLDVYRTFPSLKIFENKLFSKNIHSILLEFSNRGQNMGYYQGMNFICLYLMLLFGAEEEISVYAMIKLFSLKSKIYNINFEELFINDFCLLRNYMKLIHEKIDELYPDFNNHLEKIGVIDEIWYWKWIELCFLTSVGYDVASKIIDIVFAYGVDSLVGICLAVIEIFYEDIKKCEDLVGFNQIINNGEIKMNKKQKEKFYKIVFNDIKTNKYNLL